MNIIGIDPAFRKNGFAIAIVHEDKTVRFKVFKSFLYFMRWATDPEEVPQGQILVGIENSNLQDATFDMSGSKKEVAKKSRNVGANQAASQLTVDFCRWVFGNNHVVEMSPREKGKKWSELHFKGVVKSENHRLLGYKGMKSEQDKRDAYQVALAAKKMHFFKAARIRV